MGDYLTLSLDLGSKFGWAKGRNGVIEKSGEVALLTHRDVHPGRRWLRFNEWLCQHAAPASGKMNEILYENVQAFRSSQASMVYGALRAEVEKFCLVYDIRLSSLTPGEIKGDFTGNGNAKKEMMCEVALNLGWQHGQRGTRDKNDECDAIALYWCVCLRRQVQPRFLHQTPA